jgi:hypothetical protein
MHVSYSLDIFKVKNTMVKSVYSVMDYTIYILYGFPHNLGKY